MLIVSSLSHINLFVILNTFVSLSVNSVKDLSLDPSGHMRFPQDDSKDMKAISIYLTCKNNAEAKKIANALLKKKLVACANFISVNSQFLWKKKVESGREVLIIFKSLNKNLAKIEKEISNLHSYKVPVISVVEIQLNGKAQKWLINELK